MNTVVTYLLAIVMFSSVSKLNCFRAIRRLGAYQITSSILKFASLPSVAASYRHFKSSSFSLGLSTSTMQCPTAVEIFRKDYKESNYLIPNINLHFQLGSDSTIVKSVSKITCKDQQSDLVLDGENLKLLSVKIDDKSLSASQYQITPTSLIISSSAIPSNTFELQIEVEINPAKNLALSGLYRSGSMLCTQCEAMGFRRITCKIQNIYFQIKI